MDWHSKHNVLGQIVGNNLQDRLEKADFEGRDISEEAHTVCDILEPVLSWGSKTARMQNKGLLKVAFLQEKSLPSYQEMVWILNNRDNIFPAFRLLK